MVQFFTVLKLTVHRLRVEGEGGEFKDNGCETMTNEAPGTNPWSSIAQDL